MMDTIKVGIPLTRAQHQKLTKIVAQDDSWTWALFNQGTGKINLTKFKGLADIDGESYHRQLRYEFPPDFIKDSTVMWVEFSLPKMWYGQNVQLLYDWLKPLEYFRELLVKQFGLRGNQFLKLAPVTDWQVNRVDICYAYQMPSQQAAQIYLDSLKHLTFPRKKPNIYPESLYFPGGSYTFKVYLKHPEFMAHDYKELIKREDVNDDWLNWVIESSKGVLRVEAELRRKYLRRNGIKTVGDLLGLHRECIWDDGLVEGKDGFSEMHSLMAVMVYLAMEKRGVKSHEFRPDDPTNTPLADGCYYAAPPLTIALPDGEYHHPGGGFTWYQTPKTIYLLRRILNRFLGGNQGMQTADRVKQLLLDNYTPNKAGRLAAFWLFVQRYGSSEAKEFFGSSPYYRDRSDLKKAGVSLVETDQNVIKVDPDFFTNFKLNIPSEYVVNRHDNFRDSSNILNLPKQDAS